MNKDYKGNTLSQEQVEFFKDSKIRKDNKLLVMYHGSTSNFEEFNQPINWFTTSKNYVTSYSLGNKIYAAYLNCREYFNCGAIDLPVFKTISFNDKQLSTYSILLINKLGISEDEFKDIIDFVIETNQLTEEEICRLKLFSIVMTTKFANIVKSEGYDSILMKKDEHICVGVFNPEDIKSIYDKMPTNSRNTNETKVITFGDLEFNKKTDTRKRMKGRGTRHFGTGSVIYDLKSGTFRKRREPREVKETLNKNLDCSAKGNVFICQDYLEELSIQQEKYFKDSKIRDKDGNLLICYHGTPNPGFKEFNSPESKSQFGKYKFKTNNVNFFTTNKESAKGYTDIGVEENNNIYACYLNVVNPYIVSNTTKADIKSWQNIQDKTIRKKEIQLFDKLFKKWSNVALTNSYLNELNTDFYPLGIEFRIAKGYESYEDIVDVYKVQQNNLTTINSKMSSYDLIDLFDNDTYGIDFKEFVIGEESNEDDYYYTSDDIVRWVLYLNEYEHANYDGIIIPDIIDVGPRGSVFEGETTDIITLKSSNQIKLISNTEPTSSRRIDESR